jgi:nucleolar protein 9
MDPFASHVIRALLLLLSPSMQHNNSIARSHSTLRSKKSAAWKARQAPMKNVFTESKGKMSETSNIELKQFREAAAKFVRVLREDLGANEVRALAADKVASPVLQVELFSMPVPLIAAYIVLDAT